MRTPLAALLGLTLLTGCFRTHYENFSPANPNRAPLQGVIEKRGRSWQHFFLFGWIPVERVIDARALCGGADKVVTVQTRQTFLEGLVETFAGYYINIYAPWDGAVYCNEPPSAPAPAAPLPTDPAAPPPATQPAPAPTP